MFAHLNDFCKGVAMVLRGESLKASCYVKHGYSLGFLREKMVRNFIRHETPERFRVETGLIRNHETEATSRQCDLLIHDQAATSPIYRWEEFVVIHAHAARAVVEVKSKLFDNEFHDLLGLHESIHGLQGSNLIPTFGYGLSGASFDTCIEYVKDAVIENRLNLDDDNRHLNWPNCFVIQDRHCIGVSPLGQKTTGMQPLSFCLVDLGEADDSTYTDDGIETGFFLQIYTAALELKRQAFTDWTVYSWFNGLPLKPNGKAYVTRDGVAHRGNIS
jgi:hypothetical protein